jgi:hypothetical protein
MKRIILAIFGLVYLVSVTHGQTQYYAKAGVNFNSASVSNILSDEKLSAGLTMGYSAAVGVNLTIKELVFLQLGFEWMQRGYVNKFYEPWVRNNFWYNHIENGKCIASANYIGIPITAAYYIDLFGLKFFAQGGAYTSFGVYGSERVTGRNRLDGERIDDEWRGVFLSGDFNVNNDNYVIGKNRVDNGIILGLGIEFEDFHIGLQHQRSLRNAIRSDFDLRYRTISLYVLAKL